MDEPRYDEVTKTYTTGHSYDGIEELNTPLPRWWLWTLYLTIVWAVIYTIAYPAWPLVSSATSGFLGYSTRGEVAAEIARVEEANFELNTQLAAVDLTTLQENAPLQQYAVSAGASVFANNCSQCHGSGAAGSVGYPNLLDDDWLWGGDIEAIATTVRHGIRNEQDEDARYSEMPAYGELLEDGEIPALVAYVKSLSGLDHDAALVEQGAELFMDNCTACHGENGMGDRDQGAPNLTDSVWLYGSSDEALTETITYSRFGVMPPWSPRLSDAQVNAVAAYVHQLGGGE
ncbi:cytochrome-c oxidase, cbb3-type subunit III [Litoreibacter arenae]|uniref:Cbb3-type cytochrome c oxidase subunit n=1 Tax=Litoreibacter arenae DSM 19593 TaxID=1123360 RepID=S9Q6K7_9RHOB|nr:cytochrome-c oxidase, cbb3-type subunit III [Litoreibacter arenae]EPX77006.1 Cytochrome c oxidase subunit CcoP [Litoreibacter arenae DSM 19593]